MGDVHTVYETGLNRLLTQLGRDHPRYTEALVLQQRLLENLARARLYGDTETTRAERAQIFDALNRLTLEAVGDSFSALFLQDSNIAPLRGSRTVNQGAVSGPVHTGGGDISLGQKVDTDGGACITGDVRVVGGDFVGGDKVITPVSAQGDFHHAVEHYEHVIAIAREQGDRQTEAIHLQDLGLTLLRLADAEPDHRQAYLSSTADALRQAMELFDTLGVAPLLRARARYHLGRCYHRLGRWREAIILLEQARETFSRYKTRPELAHTLLELGRLYHVTHDFESAYTYLRDALRLFRRLGDTDGIAVTQEALGSLALQTARLSEAITRLQEARQGYAALRRSDRVRVVDDLLRIAHQAYQPAGGGETTP